MGLNKSADPFQILLLTCGSEHIMTPFSEVITPNEIPRPAKNLEFYPALSSRNVQTAEVGHYADHDFTAHAHHSWTPRSGFVQRALRTHSGGSRVAASPENGRTQETGIYAR